MRRRQTSPDLEWPIVLEPSEKPAYQQVSDAIGKCIRNGQLRAGTRLPPSRVLAGALGLNRNVIVAALEHLLLEGYIRTHGRGGTFVSPNITPDLANKSKPKLSRWQQIPDTSTIDSPAFDFRLGRAAIHEFPLEVWKSAWRQVARDLPPADAGPVEGHADLRHAIASYLGRARGINCQASDIFITAGANAALRLVTHGVLHTGPLNTRQTLAFENPGYPLVRTLALEIGANTLPIEVDNDGLKVEALIAHRPAPIMVHITPSHQYPLGGRLPIARRQALLGWAAQHDSLILENDYESEFRYDSSPLPALASLDDTGHVVYVGTFSKALTPALRIGYIVGPPALILRCKQLALEHGERVASPAQHVLTVLLENGALERHIRRVRREYATCRDTIMQCLAPHFTLRGTQAGLHMYLELACADQERQLLQACHTQGVALEMLEPYCVGERTRFGALLGYGGTSTNQLIQGIRQISKIKLY
jgi:GntR family transcriptional regulator / MocR family aminotransferase